MAERQFTSADSLGRVAEGLSYVIEFEVGKLANDLVGAHPVGEHRDDRGNGDPQSTDARLTSHLVLLRGDAFERHGKHRTCEVRDSGLNCGGARVGDLGGSSRWFDAV